MNVRRKRDLLAVRSLSPDAVTSLRPVTMSGAIVATFRRLTP